MTKITLRKIVTSLIGSIMPLAMFAGRDNVAPQAKKSQFRIYWESDSRRVIWWMVKLCMLMRESGHAKEA